MVIFDFIKSLFGAKKNKSKSKLIDIYIEDNKCSNQMKIIFRKDYDIQKVYADNREAAYEIKKVVVCDNCYNKINLHLEFDKKYNIIKKEIENGKIISEDEFESKN